MKRRILSDLLWMLPFALGGAVVMNILLAFDGRLALAAVGLLGLWAGAELFGRRIPARSRHIAALSSSTSH